MPRAQPRKKETPLARRNRLREERGREVNTRSPQEWAETLQNSMHGTPLMPGLFIWAMPSFPIFGGEGRFLRVFLSEQNPDTARGYDKVAEFQMEIKNDRGRMDVIINEVQGLWGGKRQTLTPLQVKSQTGRSWIELAGQRLVDKAYESGFDRLLLRDYRTLPFYKNPHITAQWKGKEHAKEKIRERIRTLYDKVRKAGQFNKKIRGFYVREFP